MNNYQKSLIEEHSQLVVRINKLQNYLYTSASDNDNKIEYANKAVQLAAMKKYEEALNARLANAGVVYEDGEYFEHIACIKTEDPELTPDKSCGSDFDADCKKVNG